MPFQFVYMHLDVSAQIKIKTAKPKCIWKEISLIIKRDKPAWDNDRSHWSKTSSQPNALSNDNKLELGQMNINVSAEQILGLFHGWQNDRIQKQAHFLVCTNRCYNEIMFSRKSWNKHLWINKICSLSRVSRAETKHVFVFWKIKQTKQNNFVLGNIWVVQ